MKAKHYGLLLVILSPILSSVATIFKSGAVKLLTPFMVASIGGLLGGIIILAYLFFSGNMPKWGKLKENARDLASLTILRPLLGVTIFAFGLSMTTGIKAIFFTKVEPYFVLFWFWSLERGKVRKFHILLLAVHIIGAVLLSTGGLLTFGAAQMGDLLVIIAMGFLSLSYFFGKRLTLSIGAKSANGISMLIAGVLLLPLAVFLSPAGAWSFSIGWEYLLAYIILFNVIGLTMWFASLKTVKTWIVSALRAVGPLVGAPFAFLLLGETLTLIQIIGAAIVLVTSALIAKEHLTGK
jgi:drug/metabolite transporter (DMT)-like permease